MKKIFFISIFTFVILLTNMVDGSTINPEKQTEKFITAVQKKDFKTIFDTSYYYQMELSQIKANNPKALWQKLTTEYYESKKSVLFEQKEESLTDAWVRFGGEIFGSPTDPAKNILALLGFLLPSPKWKVVESKKEKQLDRWSGRQYDVFIVYVTLGYKTVEESPVIGSKVLKETILGFLFDAKTGLYMRSSRVVKGDVYWDKVPLKILSVNWSADNLSGLYLTIKGIGGTPPYHSTTMCGEWIIEKMKAANITSSGVSISISLGARFPDESFPLQCIAKITDKSGQGNTAVFTVPEWFTGVGSSFCYIHPMWGQEEVSGFPTCITPIFELKSGGINQEQEKRLLLAEKEWAEIEEIKLLLAKKEFDKIIEIGENAVDPLIVLLMDDKDDEVRKNAAEVLGKIGDRRAVEPLITTLNDRRVRHYAIMALGEIGDEMAVGALISSLKYEEVSDDAIYALVKTGGKVIEPLIIALKDGDKSVRSNAAYALGEIGDKMAVDALVSALKDESDSVRSSAVVALGIIGDERTVEYLIDVLKGGGDWSVRADAAWALGEIKDRRAMEPLRDELEGFNNDITEFYIIYALYRLGAKNYQDYIVKVIYKEERNIFIRINAAFALAESGDKQALETIIAELKSDDKWVRRTAERKLKKLGWSSATNLSYTDSQSKAAELQKLKTFIADQWKLVAQIPEPKSSWRELVNLAMWGKYDDYSTLYLMALNRRNLANDAFIVADKFLKKGDLENAKKYANLATRHYIESNELFKSAEQAFIGSVEMTAQTLEDMYRLTKEASKYGWYLMCGPKCYEVADYVFLMTDFAMDYGLEGMDEAKKNLIVNAFVKTLLKTSGVSKWIENRTTHLIGDSGLYGLMDKTINSAEFQEAFMEALAESGAYTTQKMADEGTKTVIKNSLDFIKGSSNLKLAD